MSLAAVDLSTHVPSTSAAVEMTLRARDQPQFSEQPIMIGELKWRPQRKSDRTRYREKDRYRLRHFTFSTSLQPTLTL